MVVNLKKEDQLQLEDMFADRRLWKGLTLKRATCLKQGKGAPQTNIVRVQGLWLSSDE